MPTAASSTDARAGFLHEQWRAVRDVGHLMRFRTGTVRRRGRLLLLVGSVTALTAAIGAVPAFVPGAGDLDGDGRALDVLLVLPSALAGFVVLMLASAAASGGGRELLARDPASIHPLSPTTDHLGALLLAPLNVAFVIQTWALIGATAYAFGPDHLLGAQVIVVAWVCAAVAVAQVLAWSLEGLRRVPHGIVGVRLLIVVVLGLALGLQVTDKLASLFDELPTQWIVVGMQSGGWRWGQTLLLVLTMFVVAVVLGAVPAHIAAHRLPRDELRVESGQYAARGQAGSDLAALVRTDRASVWRAVPMRRGVAVLAIGPGIVALLGDLQWNTMTVLPGLVASGGALLYGVNAWCLDSRGALWRESLPVSPTTAFDARAYVLGEFLLTASLVTVALAAVRAGVPSGAELAAMVCALSAITLQVVAAALRWSGRRPFAVDLRSARATPVPPALMVGYSARLAVSTTFTGLAFSLLARSDDPLFVVVLTLPFLVWSGTRLMRTRRAWAVPETRARIVTTVAVA